MPSAPPANNAPLRGKRILVVEDEFLILLDIQSTLEAAGASAIVAASRVNEALDAIAESERPDGAFDVALLDLKLENEDTGPVAERLASAGIPFAFLTGAPDDIALAKRFGSAPVVGKPFDSAILIAALEHAMAKRR